jgi:hypothetical protein
METKRAHSRNIQKSKEIQGEKRTDWVFINALKEELLSSAEFIERKNKDYGNAKDLGGKILNLLFPNGLNLTTERDFKEYGIINNIIGKLCRFSNLWDRKAEPNFESIGDTLKDMGHYSFILKIMIKERQDEIE